MTEESHSRVRFEFLLSKLDALLLSMGSFLSIIYAVINIYVYGTLVLAYFVPIGILYLVPIWIGYIRGAITLEKRLERLEERIRGWIYLFGASIGYLAHFSVVAILEWHVVPHPDLLEKFLLFTVVILLTIGFMYILFFRKSFPGFHFHKVLYRRLEVEMPSYNTEKIIQITNRNAILLGVWLYSFTLLIARFRGTFFSIFLLSLLLFGILFALIQGERRVRHYVERSLNP